MIDYIMKESKIQIQIPIFEIPNSKFIMKLIFFGIWDLSFGISK
jgi:hypothetical protein